MSEVSDIAPLIQRDALKAIQSASDIVNRATLCAVRVQSFYRASVVRGWYNHLISSVRLIQRVWRGYLDRCCALAHRLESSSIREMNAFAAAAIEIQRHFKGYWSRLYVHDFYARKRFALEVASRGERTVAFLKEEGAIRLAKEQEDNRLANENRLARRTRQQHHLISTKTIPGVFNPPYATPTLLGEPIEAHIKKQIKLELNDRRKKRLSDPAYDGSVESSSPRYASSPLALTQAPRPPGPFRSKKEVDERNARSTRNYRTLQDSVPFNREKQILAIEQKVSRLKRIGPREFVCAVSGGVSIGGRLKGRDINKFPGNVSSDTPFVDSMKSSALRVTRPIHDKPAFRFPQPRSHFFCDYLSMRASQDRVA